MVLVLDYEKEIANIKIFSYSSNKMQFWSWNSLLENFFYLYKLCVYIFYLVLLLFKMSYEDNFQKYLCFQMQILRLEHLFLDNSLFQNKGNILSFAFVKKSPWIYNEINCHKFRTSEINERKEDPSKKGDQGGEFTLVMSHDQKNEKVTVSGDADDPKYRSIF